MIWSISCKHSSIFFLIKALFLIFTNLFCPCKQLSKSDKTDNSSIVIAFLRKCTDISSTFPLYLPSPHPSLSTFPLPTLPSPHPSLSPPFPLYLPSPHPSLSPPFPLPTLPSPHPSPCSLTVDIVFSIYQVLDGGRGRASSGPSLFLDLFTNFHNRQLLYRTRRTTWYILQFSLLFLLLLKKKKNYLNFTYSSTDNNCH